MFERTLQDLIRGLRAHRASSKAQEDAFLAEAMVEIREELKGKDMALKAEGVLKVCYLLMLYPIPPPAGFAFHVVEVMSSAKYHVKQLGYLAAPMAFSGDTEEVVLTVNGIKKDLLSSNASLPPLPLTALPHLLSLSPSLSTTLHPDILHLLTHSSPRVRKRAVLCLLPCWEAFPEGLKEGFGRLRERLQDEDQGVVGATVGVVMELSRRQGGKNYLPLAPELFGILTGSTNNWMLIKVVKLFAILTPLEPRLVRKLLPPITNLISSTSAISLLYECVRTCIVGGMLDPDRPEGEALAQVCVEKLGGYLRDEGGDQNLRYISLLAMVKIIPTHPHLVAEYQDEILESLEDPDVSIRMRALDLVSSMVDRDNIQNIVNQLLAHLSPSKPAPLASAAASLSAIAEGGPRTKDTPSPSTSGAYRLTLTNRLLATLSNDEYANVTDLPWAISVLIDISYVSQVDVGETVNRMLCDLVARGDRGRNAIIPMLERVVGDDDFRERASQGTGEEGLLEAAVYVCGEYPEYLRSPLSAISSILSPTLNLTSASSSISTSLQSALKIFSFYCASSSSSWTDGISTEIKNLVTSIKSGLGPYITHDDIEIQERAFELNQLISFVEADVKSHQIPKSSQQPTTAPRISGLEGGFEDTTDHENGNQDQPSYPKSMFLFHPLFTAYPIPYLQSLETSSYTALPEGLDLDRDIVPGGGFADVHLELDVDSEDEKATGLELGEGGGAGMEELRRILREQDEVDRKQGKKRVKGKKKRVEGEVISPEDKLAKAKRKAAKKARAKEDPYYLYDEKDDKDDEDGVEDIPIVRLEDDEIPDDVPLPSEPIPAQAPAPAPDVKDLETSPTPASAPALTSGAATPVSVFNAEADTPIGGDVEIVRVKKKKPKKKVVA